MLQKNIKVELIPWVHDISALAHEDVIRYIRKLPKNSHLVLEVSPGNRILISKLMDIMAGKAPSRVHGGLREQELIKNVLSVPPGILFREWPPPGMWAVLEVLHECGQRNITAVPLETQVSRERGLRGYSNVEHMDEVRAAGFFRIEAFLRQLQTVLWKFKGEKLPVLAGLGYVSALKKGLDAKGLAASINTSIFTQKPSIEKALGIYEKHKVAALPPHADAEVFFLTDAPRKEFFFRSKERIANELRQKAARVYKKCADRKLQELMRQKIRPQRRK